MKVTVQYSIVFGKLDRTDFSPWEIELSAQEEKVYRAAIENGYDPNDVPNLEPVLSRAYDQIEEDIARTNEDLGEEFEDGWNICVQF